MTTATKVEAQEVEVSNDPLDLLNEAEPKLSILDAELKARINQVLIDAGKRDDPNAEEEVVPEATKEQDTPIKKEQDTPSVHKK